MIARLSRTHGLGKKTTGALLKHRKTWMASATVKSIAGIGCGLFLLAGCAVPPKSLSDFETSSLRQVREATHSRLADVPGTPPPETTVASDETLDECQLGFHYQPGYDDIVESYRCALTRQIVFVSPDAASAGLEVTSDIQAMVFEANGLKSEAPFGASSTATLLATQEPSYADPMRLEFGRETRALSREREADDALLASLASGQQAAFVLTVRDEYFNSDPGE